MANHKKTEYSARLKKFYSTMSEAIKLSEIEQGLKTYEWNNPNTCYDYDLTKEYYSKYLLPYITYLNIEKLSTTDYYNKMDFKWITLSENSPIIYLNDGSLLFINECYDMILYDINGDKGPNKYGKDVFDFYIVSSSDGDEISNHLPHFNTYSSSDTEGLILETREQAKSSCSKGELKCTYMLQLDGWEFKDDYPFRL